MNKCIMIMLLFFSSFVAATELPPLPSQLNQSPHRLFISTEKDPSGFDSWTIDSGYSYNLFDKIDLYVGARIDNSNDISQSGFMSGVSYQFNDRVSVKSTLHSHKFKEETNSQVIDTQLSAEVSNRVRLTENLDLHATVDYQQWQQGVEVGLGFRF